MHSLDAVLAYTQAGLTDPLHRVDFSVLTGVGTIGTQSRKGVFRMIC